jgi:sigma-B regulation protein RsbU (phosphoserine phosphatase)
LIVEDSEFDARYLVGVLKQGGYDPTWIRVETAQQMRTALTEQTWEVILSDYNLPEFSAPDALVILQKSGIDLPFIIISGGIGEDVAVASMKAGAHDYLMKGNLARLVPAVEREMREAEVRRGRQMAEEALRDSEQRYRLLWENSTDAVLLTTATGKIQFANPATVDVFGYRPEQVIGHPFSQLLADEARSRFPEWAKRYLQPESAHSRHTPIETIGCHQAGRPVPIEIGFNQVELERERYLVAFIRDISERKRAEQESRLLQSISLAVHAAPDLNTALVVVLQTVCETAGWTLGQAWLPSQDRLTLECSPACHQTEEDLLPFREASEKLKLEPGQGLPGKVWSARAPVWIRDISHSKDAPRARVAEQVGILAAVGIPVMAEDQTVAVIEFFLREMRDQDERMTKLFSAIAAQVGGVIGRKRAEQELRETEEQFRVARDIQERLFPKAAPTVPGFDVAGTSHPASAAGGDYFDYLPLLEDRTGVVVGDVTGHGIGPALLMAETRAYLRLLAQEHADVASILSHANRALAGDIDFERFITMLLVSLDPKTRRLTYVNAGHPAAYVLDPSGAVKARLQRTGVPLGIRPNTAYPPATEVQLASGDLIVILTDGIDEAVSPEEELFGIERTLEVIRRHQAQPAEQIVQELYIAVRQFSRNTPQLDDATVVVIKVQ